MLTYKERGLLHWYSPSPKPRVFFLGTCAWRKKAIRATSMNSPLEQTVACAWECTREHLDPYERSNDNHEHKDAFAATTGNDTRVYAQKQRRQHRGVFATTQDNEYQDVFSTTTATMIHNATPHSSTGISPYAALYGREPLLPGWQGYTSDTTNEARLMNLNSAMVQRLMQVSIQEMQPRRSPVSSLQPGDLCCYHLPTTTATHDPTIEKELDRKFRPTWSAPMVVVAVAPTQVTIRPYGAARPVRKLSVHDVRKLEFSESAYLQELNTYILERHYPRVPCPCPIGSCSCPYQEQSHPSKKRPRPTPRLIYSPVLLP